MEIASDRQYHLLSCKIHRTAVTEIGLASAGLNLYDLVPLVASFLATPCVWSVAIGSTFSSLKHIFQSTDDFRV